MTDAGSEFQTDGAAHRKERFAKSARANGWMSSGVPTSVVSVRWRGGWCVGWGTAVQTCSESCRHLVVNSVLNRQHNWLRPRDEHVTQNLCQSAVRERLSKYVTYFILIFPGLAYWSDPWADFDAQYLNYAQSRKEVPVWGPHDGWPHSEGGQIPQKPSKLGVNMHCRASRLRVNDWRHRRMTLLALFVAALSSNFRRPLPNVR